MARVAIAMLWLALAGSAHAVYYTGRMTLDDGRTATLALHHFVWKGSPNEGNRAAKLRCRGDACFAPTGWLNLLYGPLYEADFDVVNDPTLGHGYYTCVTQDRVGLPRSCRIASSVVCSFASLDDPTLVIRDLAIVRDPRRAGGAAR